MEERWVFKRISGCLGYQCEVCSTWVYEDAERVCECNNQKDIIMNLVNAGLKDTDFNKAESLLRGGEIFSLDYRNDLAIHYDNSFLPEASPYRYGNVPLDSGWKQLSRWMMEKKIQFPCLCWVSDYDVFTSQTCDIILSKDGDIFRGLNVPWKYITPLSDAELKKYVPSR